MLSKQFQLKAEQHDDVFEEFSQFKTSRELLHLVKMWISAIYNVLGLLWGLKMVQSYIKFNLLSEQIELPKLTRHSFKCPV